MADVGRMRVALLALHQNRLWLWVPAFAGTTAFFLATISNSRSVQGRLEPKV
jgi:hypothetical protein